MCHTHTIIKNLKIQNKYKCKTIQVPAAVDVWSVKREALFEKIRISGQSGTEWEEKDDRLFKLYTNYKEVIKV